MADPNSREGHMWIERTSDSGYFGRGEYVTFFFDFWGHQIDRCTITIVDGVQGTESTEEIARKVKRMRNTQKPSVLNAQNTLVSNAEPTTWLMSRRK
jgi:hypothetical protein